MAAVSKQISGHDKMNTGSYIFFFVNNVFL